MMAKRRRNRESWCDECCSDRSGDLSSCRQCGLEMCDCCLGDRGFCRSCRKSTLTPQRYSLLSPPQRRQLRDDYVTAQRGICLYCNVPLSLQPPRRIVDYPVDWSLFPVGFLNHPVHLQHCHKTDMTEGAVHAMCNAVMWVREGR